MWDFRVGETSHKEKSIGTTKGDSKRALKPINEIITKSKTATILPQERFFAESLKNHTKQTNKATRLKKKPLRRSSLDSSHSSGNSSLSPSESNRISSTTDCLQTFDSTRRNTSTTEQRDPLYPLKTCPPDTPVPAPKPTATLRVAHAMSRLLKTSIPDTISTGNSTGTVSRPGSARSRRNGGRSGGGDRRYSRHNLVRQLSGEDKWVRSTSKIVLVHRLSKFVTF